MLVILMYLACASLVVAPSLGEIKHVTLGQHKIVEANGCDRLGVCTVKLDNGKVLDMKRPNFDKPVEHYKVVQTDGASYEVWEGEEK